MSLTHALCLNRHISVSFQVIFHSDSRSDFRSDILNSQVFGMYKIAYAYFLYYTDKKQVKQWFMYISSASYFPSLLLLLRSVSVTPLRPSLFYSAPFAGT